MENQQGVELTELAAQVLALRNVVRVLVGQSLGHSPEALKEVREAALQTIKQALANRDLGSNPEEFTHKVEQAVATLLADMPAGVGFPGR